MTSLDARRTRTALVGAAIGVVLVAAAMAWPAITGIFVHNGISGLPRFPPLHANWSPRVTATSWLPVVVAAVILLVWPRVVALRWPAYLLALVVAAWSWTMSLALVDGTDGLGRVFTRRGEYVADAQAVGDVSSMLSGFVDRIPLDAADNWGIHVAGHPPGALLVFVGIDRAGITDPALIGLVVVTLGCTAFAGAAIAVRRLAGEHWARRAGVWWVLLPAAVWVGVSGDAIFMAVSAWGLALLAVALTARSTGAEVAAGLGAGVLLGATVYLSYGLVLLAVPALAVVVLARRFRPVVWVLAGALLVVATFTAAGFAWWEAYGVLHERYYDGVAADRPYGYWVWANLAAWTFAIGLAGWAGLAEAVRSLAHRPRAGHGTVAVSVLALSGLACVVLATLSGMSKAEVERIWLPFSLWAVLGASLLGPRLRHVLVIAQVVTALAVQHLLLTRW
ncbi:hypothetical protein [Mumia sp. Pv 4-285]|uniref:hypothetical protein n=1 Tax=Mumia qirimensis TaxID=3234852 RepID=UPI00351D852A